MALIDYIDGPNRRVYLSSETISIDVHPIDIYKEMRTLRRTDEDLRKYELFMAAFGNVDKGGGKATERYVQLLLGTRIVPYDTTHVLNIIGTIITDDGQEGVYCFDRSPLTSTTIVDINYMPPQVEVITVPGSGGATPQEVWEYHTRTLTSGSASGDVNVVSVGGVTVTDPSDLGATPAQNAEELLNTDIHQYTTDFTIGEALHRIRHFERKVFVDTNADVNGDGSDGFPFNNVNDAKDYAENHNITNIIASGDIVIPHKLKNMTIHGVGLPRVDFNGQDVRGSSFIQCSLKGSYDDSIIAEQCFLEDGLLLRGHFMNCELSGNYTAAPNSHILLYKCMSGIPGPDYSTISMDSGLPTAVSVRGYNGGLHITNMDHEDDIITVEISEGKLVVESSCTLGTLVARGDIIFNDLSNGTLVSDETTKNFIDNEHTRTKNTVIAMS